MSSLLNVYVAVKYRELNVAGGTGQRSQAFDRLFHKVAGHALVSRWCFLPQGPVHIVKWKECHYLPDTFQGPLAPSPISVSSILLWFLAKTLFFDTRSKKNLHPRATTPWIQSSNTLDEGFIDWRRYVAYAAKSLRVIQDYSLKLYKDNIKRMNKSNIISYSAIIRGL